MYFLRVRLLHIIFYLTFYSKIGYSENDSIDFFPKQTGTKLWKPIIGFDAFRSYYSGTPVKFNGFRFGAQFKGVHRFGFGFYGLKKDLVYDNINVDYPTATDTSLVKFQLNYASMFYERVLLRYKKWELSIPLHLGAGGLNAFVEDSLGNYQKYYATSFSLISFGLNAKYFILPWLAPRAGGGIRITYNAPREIRRAFNAIYYTFGLSIIPGELYKKLKN